MKHKNTYGTPQEGCYLDQANYSMDEMDRAIIKLAISFGFEMDSDSAQRVSDYDNRDLDAERDNGPDDALFDDLAYVANDAINYLNSEEPRDGYFWGHDGEAGAFGLWYDAS